MPVRLEEYLERLKERDQCEYKWSVELRGTHFFIKVFKEDEKRFEARLMETGILNLYTFDLRGKTFEVEFFL